MSCKRRSRLPRLALALVLVLPPSAAEAEEGLESAAAVEAWSLADPALRQGEHYQINRPVEIAGYQMHFVLETDFGRMRADSLDLLRLRLQEIEALARIAELSRDGLLLRSTANTVTLPLRLVRRMVTQPIDTATALPRGIWGFFGRLREMDRAGSRKSIEGWEGSELLGYEAARRQIAHRMGADVYTLNEALQRELTELAWTVWIGGAGATVLSQIQPAPGRENGQEGDRFEVLIRDSTPEDLRKQNRARLEKLGAKPTLIEDFLKHPWISPRRETRILDLVERLRGVEDRTELLELAVVADSEADIVFAERVAELAAYYHLAVRALRRAFPTVPVPFFENENGHLVVLLPIDFLYWDERAATVMRNTRAKLLEPRELAEPQLLVSGWISERARRELESGGWSVRTRFAPSAPLEQP